MTNSTTRAAFPEFTPSTISLIVGGCSAIIERAERTDLEAAARGWSIVADAINVLHLTAPTSALGLAPVLASALNAIERVFHADAAEEAIKFTDDLVDEIEHEELIDEIADRLNY
jgi:hypothetical protein